MKRHSPVNAVLAVFTFVFALLASGSRSLLAQETVLYSFGNTGTSGANPVGGLVMDAKGNFYGTTSDTGYGFNSQGESTKSGTVYELSPATGGGYTLTTLYAFQGGADGERPVANLIFDAQGNLYGTTEGDSNDAGTAFELSPPESGSTTWTKRELYNFNYATDGAAPVGALVFDKSGNLYTALSQGGPRSEGAVIELTPTTSGPWTETVLHSFGSASASDGAFPEGTLIFDAAGNLYGTTYGGGTNTGASGGGVAFELVAGPGNTWTEKILYNFEATSTDAAKPTAGLVFDGSGNLYGTTPIGGSTGYGTVFQLTPSGGSWTEKVIHSFDQTADGSGPEDTLIIDSAGNLYGTTENSGSADGGIVFELTPAGGNFTETIRYNFGSTSGDGSTPLASLVMDSAGNLFGTTQGGGAYGDPGPGGTVFEIASDLGPAAAPQFSVPAGTYATEQGLVLTDTTANATIYYTTDGSMPTVASSPYVAELNVDMSETVRAIATAPGFAQSQAASAAYVINQTAFAISPMALSFASTTVGDSTASQTVTISNNGTRPATISTTAIGGANSSSFTRTSNCPETLAASASCTISVVFTPTAAGSLSATLSIFDNTNGSPQMVALSGTATAAVPVINASPMALSFASTTVGDSAAAQRVTLSNTGSAAATVSSISITGTNGSSFTETNTCGTTLAAGASCTISVTFTPATAGSLTAALSIADNATGSPQAITLSGTATAAVPVLGASPNTLSFASTPVGTSSAAQTVTISNTGTGAAAISSITITGTNSASFTETKTCGATLAAEANCTVSVTFTPTTAGSLTAMLAIADNAAGSPQKVTLSGTATPAEPVISPSPTALTFASTTVGDSAATQKVTISNTGSAAATISSIGISGVNSSSFTETKTCGATLAAGANCTVSVTFTPASAGSMTALLSIADSATGSPQTVALSGTATTAMPVLGPSPAALSFASTTVGTSTAAQQVTFSNTGTGAATISSITIIGTNASSFAETSTCGTTLAAGSSCTINVTFTPAAAGTLIASLSIADNATGSPQAIALSGTATAAPVAMPIIGASPNALSFASTTVGVSAAAQAVTLSNSGSASATISSVSITGTNETSFTQTNSCGTSLAAGASCTISVVFAPTAAGSLTASLNIADNAAGSPQTIALSGTGAAAAAASYAISLSPTSASVTAGQAATTSVSVMPAGGFSLPVTFACSGLPAGAVCSFSPSTVTPDGMQVSSSTLTVQTAVASAMSRSSVSEMHGGSGNELRLAGLGFGALLGFGLLIRRRRASLWLTRGSFALMLLFLAGAVGCGGGSSAKGSPTTSQVTVTATSGSLTQSAVFSLTIE